MRSFMIFHKNDVAKDTLGKPKLGPVLFQIPPEHNLEILALPYGLSDHALMRPDFGHHKVLAKIRDCGQSLTQS